MTIVYHLLPLLHVSIVLLTLSLGTYSNHYKKRICKTKLK